MKQIQEFVPLFSQIGGLWPELQIFKVFLIFSNVHSLFLPVPTPALFRYLWFSLFVITNIDVVRGKRRYGQNILQWSKKDFKSRKNTSGDYYSKDKHEEFSFLVVLGDGGGGGVDVFQIAHRTAYPPMHPTKSKSLILNSYHKTPSFGAPIEGTKLQ